MWSSPLLLLLPRCCLVKLLVLVPVFWLSSTRQTTERQTKPKDKAEIQLRYGKEILQKHRYTKLVKTHSVYHAEKERARAISPPPSPAHPFTNPRTRPL